MFCGPAKGLTLTRCKVRRHIHAGITQPAEIRIGEVVFGLGYEAQQVFDLLVTGGLDALQIANRLAKLFHIVPGGIIIKPVAQQLANQLLYGLRCALDIGGGNGGGRSGGRLQRNQQMAARLDLRQVEIVEQFTDSIHALVLALLAEVLVNGGSFLNALQAADELLQFLILGSGFEVSDGCYIVPLIGGIGGGFTYGGRRGGGIEQPGLSLQQVCLQSAEHPLLARRLHDLCHAVVERREPGGRLKCGPEMHRGGPIHRLQQAESEGFPLIGRLQPGSRPGHLKQGGKQPVAVPGQALVAEPGSGNEDQSQRQGGSLNICDGAALG